MSEPAWAALFHGLQFGSASSEATVVVADAVSDASGAYSSGPLDAGDYIVQVVRPAGVAHTTPGANPTDDRDSNIGSNGLPEVITLEPGEINTNPRCVRHIAIRCRPAHCGDGLSAR